MPITMSRDAIQKAGGKYVLEPAARPKVTDVTQPVQSVDPVEKAQAALASSLDKAVATLNAAKEEKMNAELGRIIDLLSKAGGTWSATVKSRDQKGRILSIDFQQN